mgnify:CR=1 FL=1
MAYTEALPCISMPVAADYSAKQYYIMKTASGVATLCGDGEEPIGVLQNAPDAANEVGRIGIGRGVTKVVAGAAITVSAKVAAMAGGLAAPATSGEAVLGYAMEAATASGDVISVLLISAESPA